MNHRAMIEFLQDRDLFRRALFALENSRSDDHWRERYDAICALRARLERVEYDPLRDEWAQKEGAAT